MTGPSELCMIVILIFINFIYLPVIKQFFRKQNILEKNTLKSNKGFEQKSRPSVVRTQNKKLNFTFICSRIFTNRVCSDCFEKFLIVSFC